MGKHNGAKIRTDTKVLYKKSNITIRTHSRSCSDASHVTRSEIMQVKKTLSKSAEYYTDGDKVKRDLSIETGACILRRYYKSKHKRDKCSVHASSAKSKCSTVHTEFTTFKPDHACGDSRNKFDIADPTNALNIDLPSLMVENLKCLLNEWIRKYVLEDNETKKKLVHVLDSILQSLEAKVPSIRSSCCTYVIERNGEGYKVRNKKTETSSVTCQYCKQKQTSLLNITSSSVLFKKYSRLTIPLPYKHLRIISTLSIPRNMHKKEKVKKKNFVYKVKKMQKSKVAVTNNRERKVVIDISSCGMSSVSKKSYKKNAKRREKKSPSKRKGIIFLPPMFYKSTSDFTSTSEIEDQKKNEETQEVQLDAMPSLVKSLYADDPANVTSTDKIPVTYQNRIDNCTMTDVNISLLNSTTLMNNNIPNVQFHEAKYKYPKREEIAPEVIDLESESPTKIDFINHSIEFPNLTITRDKSFLKETKRFRSTTNIKSRKQNTKIARRRKAALQRTKPKLNKKSTFENIKYKRFTFLYKKTKNHINKQGDILNHFRNIFKYFANHEGSRNIKLEIHCNVYPFFDIEENYSKIECQPCKEYEINMIPTDLSNFLPQCNSSFIDHTKKCDLINTSSALNAEIIPILDGAASQAKYIFKSDNSTSTSNHSIKNENHTEKGTLMTNLEVSNELRELKSAIKDFSATAEKLVHEHVKRQHEKVKEELTAAYNVPVEQKSSKLFKNVKKPTNLSNTSKGIQFSSSPKGQRVSGIKLSKGPKTTEDIAARLKKRSSSYHVIESESILKVTDMTAAADKSNDSTKPCMIKKSKSFLNVTNEVNRQKLLAFFCNNSNKTNNDRFLYKMCPGSKASFACPGQQVKLTACSNACCKSHSNASKLILPVTVSDYQGCEHDYCSSVYVEMDKPTITVKKKSGLPFWEGALYCILLWIPIIVIMVLFYNHVLKDAFSKTSPATTAAPKTFKMGADYLGTERNSSRFLMKLSDFGKVLAIEMQFLDDGLDEKRKKTNRSLKYYARLPKQMPSYIVAFAVHETYDDIATAQQMICNKRSLQSSTSSMSPAISSKTITADCVSSQKIQDNEFNETPDELEIKVDKDGNDSESAEFNEPLDGCKNIEGEDNNHETEDFQNGLPGITDYVIDDNIEENVVSQQDDSKCTKKRKKNTRNLNKNSQKKLHNHSTIRNYTFKYKKILKKKEMATKNPARAAKIKEIFYPDSVPEVVSQSSLLKDIAKDNVQGIVDLITNDEYNHDESLSLSTAKKSFISYSSEDTLTLQGSTSSKNDLTSTSSINSVIKIPSKHAMPYKTEVINVSVAVAYNPTSNENERNPSAEPHRPLFERNIISTETLVEPDHINGMTSESGSSGTFENAQNIYLQNLKMSGGTLKPNSESTYVVGNTSSEADDSLQSETTLTPTSETFMYSENLRPTPPSTAKPEKDKNYNRLPILDTVINMGIFPDIKPSTSSAISFKDKLNSVFVTGDSGKFLNSSVYEGENAIDTKIDLSKYETYNTLKKSFDTSKEINSLKNMSLPHEGDIKAKFNEFTKIHETNKSETKLWSEGLDNHPGNITELWECLVKVVDTAVKRLEQSLMDKITTELKTQLPTFQRHSNRMKDDTFVVDIDQSQGDKVLSNKEVFVDKNDIQSEIDEGLQCTLVGNKVIDNIMLKLSVEDPRIPGTATKSLPKVKRPKIFRDYFEVLKPPIVKSALVEGKGDTVTVSSTIPSEIEEVDSFRRVKAIFQGPLTFLRENMFVLTSVPTFFVMLLCVYGIIIFVMKPW